MSYKVKETIINKNVKEFMSVEIPEIDGIKIDFSTKQIIEKSIKTDKVLNKYPENYEVSISFEWNLLEDKELSESLQLATDMKFSIYRYREKKYYFYTTNYTNDERKKEILNNILKVVKDYAQDYKKQEEKESELKRDFEKQLTLESRDLLLMPYEKDGLEKMFLVCAKERLGGDLYSTIRNAAFYSNYLQNDKSIDINNPLTAKVEDVQKYFPNQKRKIAFFLIGEKNYNDIKELIISLKAKEEYVNQEYAKKAKSMDLSEYEVLEDNIFGVSIKYNEDKGSFIFKGKGFTNKLFSTGKMSIETQRTLVGVWANNMIYVEEGFNGSYNSDFYMENHKRINIEFLNRGSAKDGYEVSIDDKDKLKKIKQNLENELKVWGREDLLIDIIGSFRLKEMLDPQFPTIYLTDKKCYLTYGSREKTQEVGENIKKDEVALVYKDKVVKAGDLKYIDIDSKRELMIKGHTLKGFEITDKEARYYLEEHPLHRQIRENSLILNTKTSMNEKEYKELVQLPDELKRKEEILENKLLKINIYSDLNKISDSKNSEGKKKIKLKF